MIRNDGTPTKPGYYWYWTPESLAPTIVRLRMIGGGLVFDGGPYDRDLPSGYRHNDARWQAVRAPERDTP